MNEKNATINGYVDAIAQTVNNLMSTLTGLTDSDVINAGKIRTADILITSVNSQLIVLQNELDNYFG